ncbi:DUF4012 domain-containing protein [Marmoricola sp. RAF53]|uniref:DUF4012 domain-containing protein n=1 Tax=Marmoricola sp. RAF53 TaxID=3233059 RepID=UPI003F99A194
MGGEGTTLGSNKRRIAYALIVLAGVAFGVFVWQAVSASRSLLDAREQAEQVRTQVRAGDFDDATRSLDRLGKQTARAHDATDGLLWDVGRHVPFVGANIGAVQTAAEVLDTATRGNAPVALQLSEALQEGRFRPVDGRIDIAAVEKLAPAVGKAADSIEKAADDLDEVRTGDLVFPFNDLVGDLQTQVEEARSAASATSAAFTLLPAMLGKDGPRDYLLMIQNPAELRSTGGLPGSLAVLHADQGKVTMTWQGSAGKVNGFTAPVVKLPADTEQQYGRTVATDFRDTNFTPDFPEAAQIARAMLERAQKIRVDGVVSIDPVALSGLMAGTGPVQAGHGITLTAGNVVPTLLNKSYQLLPDQLSQDDFFETVARKVFDAVMAGQGSQEQAVKGLATGASQHRVLLWSARDDEQARLSGTAIAGELGRNSGTSPEIGVYLNDSVAGKVDYYLQMRSSAAAVDCRQDGSQDLRATVALTSTVPTDIAGISSWILGDGRYVPRGTIALNLRVYGPYGGEITALRVDGQPHSVTADEHHGRQVALLPVSLKPGQQVNITADIRTARGQDGDGRFSTTPGMVPAPNGVKISSAC